MIGAIIGDIVGSIYEFDNIKTKEFEFFDDRMEYTDDSILTIATADWLFNGGFAGSYYLRYANEYSHPMGSYGTGFVRWVDRANRGIIEPYNSCGNGSAMRVSPVGWAFASEQETLDAAKRSAECTHNHPEGIKGAQATALCIFLARHGALLEDIKQRIEQEFGYDLSLTIDEIRPRYSWSGMDEAENGGTCQGSVPQAIACALQATDFEDAIRNAISIGGDSDTIGCITGGIAQALFGVPQWMQDKALSLLPQQLRNVVTQFTSAMPPPKKTHHPLTTIHLYKKAKTKRGKY
ncbi:MAG: ADP-ribosylglycohydrolase family protein [Muribaculaceae bacterium]|nr:ADP-ribosylglycohydrolase family protein [Muribaculaceae bacterium]